MKKKLAILLALCLFTVGTVNASAYIRYYNKDSETWKFEVKIAGSTKTVEFGSSRTASVTIQGGSEDCEIKTECGWVKVTDDSKIEIKAGCITVK